MTNKDVFIPADRLNSAGYPFAELERTAAKRRAQGLPLYDLSIGDPDLQPPEFVKEAVHRGVDLARAHVYPSSRGDLQVRQAIAKWFAGRFGVELDPNEQICLLIGAKEGLAQIARAVVNPGDEVGIPVPAYPVYGRAGCRMVEGKPRYLPLTLEESFLPDLRLAEGVRLLYLNYPNNPTGAVATLEFMRQVADFADSYKASTVAYDMAYSEVTWGEPTHSILEYTSNAIEFHSMSKMANATGYRIGFAVGEPARVNALRRAKEEMDSGAPLPFQFALKALLESYQGAQPPQEMTENLLTIKRRRQVVTTALESLGFTVFHSSATFYVWFKVGDDERPFIQACAEGGVLLTPGSGFGSPGWARASVTAPDQDIYQAVKFFERMTL